MKKRFYVLLLAALFVFVMVGTSACASTPADSVKPSDSASESAGESQGQDGDVVKLEMGGYEFEFDKSIPVEEREIVMVYTYPASQFGALVKAGVDDAAKEFGVNAYMMGGDDWGSATEIAILEDLINKGVDALGIQVLDVDGVTPYIQEALEAGIPVICYNGDSADSGRLGYAGADYIAQGYNAAYDVISNIAKQYPDGGKVLVTGSAISDQIQQDRNTGLQNVLKEFPDLNIELVYQDCPGDDTDIYTKLENVYLANQKDVVGWVDLGGTGILLGKVLIDYDDGNMDSDHPIFNSSADVYEERIQQIIDGWGTSAWSQNPYDQGYLPVEMFKDFFTNYDPSVFEVKSTEVWGVNRDNAQEYMDKLLAGEPIG